MAVEKGLSSDDQAVQATNDDATICKKYAVLKGYWRDDYVNFFCRSSDRRSPEISRGYYARVMSIRNLLMNFISLTSRDCQVINLGAGFDSTYWVLREIGLHPKMFVEVDFPDVTARKCQHVRTKKNLLDPLLQDGEVDSSPNELHSTHYHMMSCDMRNVSILSEKLITAGIDKSTPTFLIAECVLVYMEPHLSQAVIKWAGSYFKSAVFLNYEPIHPHDRFGIMMQRNLTLMGCSLLGIDTCPDLESQQKRFLENGWTKSWALDMNQVYLSLPLEEITRIERIEMLDERELLTQLLKHYTLSCGINDLENRGFEAISLKDEHKYSFLKQN